MSQTGSKKGGQNKLPPLPEDQLAIMRARKDDDDTVVRADATNCNYKEFHGRRVTWHMLYRLACGGKGAFTPKMGKQLQDLNEEEEGSRMALN